MAELNIDTPGVFEAVLPEGQLVVHATSEGIIADLFSPDGREARGSWAVDWDELVERCH